MKISVIVPIYKVEPFIARCAKSLMEQTLTDVEYILLMMPHQMEVLRCYLKYLQIIQNGVIMLKS